VKVKTFSKKNFPTRCLLTKVGQCSPYKSLQFYFNNKKPLFEEETRTEEAFHDFSMVEIDGELYIVISTRNLMGMFLPLLLKYDYEANTFEFCVAGNGNTSYEPIAVVK